MIKSIISLFALLPMLALAESTPAVPDYPSQKISRNGYMIEGPLGQPSPENQGFMNNPAFILTPEGVVVIDPGSSVQVGEMLLRQIRGVTEKPIIAVFNTHVHGDHWLANQAIKTAYPEAIIYGHRKMLDRVAKGEGEEWLKIMHNMTQGATEGTRVVAPGHPLEHNDLITLGGIQFRILHVARAHSDTDLMIEVASEDLLFLGDNLLNGRLGQMTHGTFRGNIEALDLALTSSVGQFIPGHGAIGGPEIAHTYRNYLSTLRKQVTSLMEEGLSDYEMKPLITGTIGSITDWAGFEGEIGRHISLAYLEVEQELF